MSMKTTFQEIKDNRPCHKGWQKLLENIAPAAMEAEVTYEQILDSNGIIDAAWAVSRTYEGDATRTFVEEALVEIKVDDFESSKQVILESDYPVQRIFAYIILHSKDKKSFNVFINIFKKHFC